VQLERRFSWRQLLAIYANRTYFGDDLVGVEAASQHFFRKEPNQLEVGEAALLAGLVRAPGRLSPVKHSDRALERRNQVFYAMVAAHAIGAEVGKAAKVSPLGIVTH
jgi:membrane peptidoglycan carboxypeptidase